MVLLGRTGAVMRSNKSIDTDVLSAGFAGLLSAGHLHVEAVEKFLFTRKTVPVRIAFWALVAALGTDHGFQSNSFCR